MATGMGCKETATFRPATVTLSRREQAQGQQATESAARVTASVAERTANAAQAQRNTSAAPESASGFRAPTWAADPLAGATLQAFKNGVLVQTTPLQQKATLFGRLANADVQLEHASISRQHAVLCFRAGGQAVLMDLASAHGTFVGSERLAKHAPRDLLEGEDMRFGASTRRYVLERRRPGSGGNTAGSSRKRSVSWPDEGDAAGPDEKRRSGSNALESTIGYSDSQPFAVNVGPVAAAPEQTAGRFADLVTPVVRPAAARPEAKGHDERRGRAAGPSSPEGGSHADRVKSLAQEEFRKFVEQGRRRSSSFYDELPPPTSGS